MRRVFVDIETTGLYPIIYRVVCVGYACDGEKHCFIDEDECEILRQSLDFLEPQDCLIGFNLPFDYGFLVLRSLKHGLNPKKLLSCERVDLLKLVKDVLADKRVSLQGLADYFGLDHGKTSGMQVPGLWEAGEYEAIKEHCMNDLDLTAQLFERLEPLMFVPATPAQINYLKALNVQFEEGITKSEASKLIENAKRGY